MKHFTKSPPHGPHEQTTSYRAILESQHLSQNKYLILLLVKFRHFSQSPPRGQIASIDSHPLRVHLLRFHWFFSPSLFFLLSPPFPLLFPWGKRNQSFSFPFISNNHCPRVKNGTIAINRSSLVGCKMHLEKIFYPPPSGSRQVI